YDPAGAGTPRGAIHRDFPIDVSRVEIEWGTCRVDGCFAQFPGKDFEESDDDDTFDYGCGYPYGTKLQVDQSIQFLTNPSHGLGVETGDEIDRMQVLYAHAGQSEMVQNLRAPVVPTGKTLSLIEDGYGWLKLRKLRVYKLEDAAIKYEFTIRGAGTLCDDFFEVIRTADECHVALLILGVPLNSFWYSDDLGDPNKPNGCSVPLEYLPDSSVSVDLEAKMNYFRGVGSPNMQLRPVCRKPIKTINYGFTYELLRVGATCATQELVVRSMAECKKALRIVGRDPN
ncbi:unnamed protein product, partial [Amoebophrya sp. A120]